MKACWPPHFTYGNLMISVSSHVTLHVINLGVVLLTQHKEKSKFLDGILFYLVENASFSLVFSKKWLLRRDYSVNDSHIQWQCSAVMWKENVKVERRIDKWGLIICRTSPQVPGTI